MIGLTPKQNEVFRFMSAQVRQTGIFPSVREIGSALDTPYSSVHRIIKILVGRGMLVSAERKAHGYQIAPPSTSVILDPDICFLVDAYASAHSIPRAKAVEALIRNGASA